MGTMALRTSERLRRQDLSMPHNSGLDNVVKAGVTSEDDGLETVGKAEATRSGSAT